MKHYILSCDGVIMHTTSIRLANKAVKEEGYKSMGYICGFNCSINLHPPKKIKGY